MDRERIGGIRGDWVLLSLFLFGLAISLLMVVRTQVGGDALCMLTRGWLLAEKGIWVPFGNWTSAGGYVPGGLTALVVGLPLTVWMDPRSPVVPILLSHVLAYGMLDWLVKETLGQRARYIFAIVYWLNPWQLYQSAWLDNSNYGFLTGAIHLWGCYRQRHRPSFFHSALLVTVIGLTAQLHLYAILMVVAAILLWWRGYWKPHWGGVVLGSLITFGALIPFFLEVSRHPEVFPGGDDTMFDSLLRVWPILKGIGYWLRYASLSAATDMFSYDFTPSLGVSADVVLSPIFFILGPVLGGATVTLPLLANIWLWRSHWAQSRTDPVEQWSGRSWLRGYALWVFAASVVANTMSPSPTMYWHGLIAFHAAVLPLVLWVDALLQTRRAPAVQTGTVVYLTLTVVLLLSMVFGSRQYRVGGRDTVGPPPRRDHEILRDLGLPIDASGRWPRENRFFFETYVRPYLASPVAEKQGSPTPRPE